MTVGIPSPRCPPPALGMNTRRIPPGRYLPASKSACNPGNTTSHCASSSSIVCPSGPGAPSFDATFNNASVNRYATSSIVAGAALPTLLIAFGAPARISPSRSRDLLRVAPFGFSAVATGRLSCTAVSSTGTAFPCPPGLDPARSTGITPPSGTTRPSDFCWAIEPSSSRSPTYRPNPAGTQQISWGETLRLCRDRVATTPSVSTGIGHRRCVAARPPRNALQRFTFVRHHDTPMASSRPALTETPQRTTSRTGAARSIPGPRPCLFSVGFPLSGLQDRTSTSDLNIRTQHTRLAATPLGSAPTVAHPRAAWSPAAPLRSDRSGRYLPPRPVSTTNSHSWWTDKRGPVTDRHDLPLLRRHPNRAPTPMSHPQTKRRAHFVVARPRMTGHVAPKFTG